jgi:uncharacterized protein YbcI
MSDAAASVPLGETLAAISTRIVHLMHQHYGRGPSRAKTYAIDDCIVCVLRNGFTAYEQTVYESGDPQGVVALRNDFQRRIEARYRAAVEELTGRRVLAVLGQAHIEPDITVAMFFLDSPLGERGGTYEVPPADLDL